MVGGTKNPLRVLLPAQFLGAFLDNAWKLFVTFALISTVAEGEGFEAASQRQTTLAFVVFSLPLMLFSLPACVLADRFPKRSILLATKLLELASLLVATVWLFANPDASLVPLVVLGFMGLQSAFFSPAKYGILPELVPHTRLSTANGALELWTFVAIIGGTALGGPLFNRTQEQPWVTGLILSMLSVAGVVLVTRLPTTVPSSASPATDAGAIRGAWQTIREDRVLSLAVMGSAFFWTLASLLSQDVLVYTRGITNHLDDSETMASIPLAVLGLGVGVGSVFAGRLSKRKVEFGLIPLGALGLAIFTVMLGWIAPELTGTIVLLGLAGLCGGLIVVPINALHQWRPPAERRGAVIALSNFFTFGGVLAGSLIAWGLSSTGLSARGILIALAGLTVAGTLWALKLLPVALLRVSLLILTHSIYRLKVIGRPNVPAEGGALLVPNHVSFIDGLLIIASTDREVRFIVDRDYYEHPLLKWFMRGLRAIPISSAGGPRVVLRAMREAGEYLEKGELVCIFPEGQITRTGMLQPFRRGLDRIVKGRDVPVIPVHLDRVWGSIFSRSGGRFLTKLPERIPYPVTVSYGEPQPPGTPLFQVRRRVLELGEIAWANRKKDRRPLHRSFVRRARRKPWRTALIDSDGRSVSRIAAAAGSVALSRALQPHWGDQQNVGILLPPSIPGALVNVAASLSGRTSVNLNYALSEDAMKSAVSQANLRTIVTSKLFLEKAGVTPPAGVEVIELADVAAQITKWERLRCLTMACFAPHRVLERFAKCFHHAKIDDIATIIFSSGSTGEPKGVLLSHFNIDSNIAGATQVLHVSAADCLLGILPLFHSFGTMALWFALHRGMRVVFHPNPLDAGAVGGLIQRHSVTLMIATPTFLQLYQRRCTPAQFGSIRLIVTGAERLSPEAALSFEEEFGIRPMEGYGTTECAPVVAVSGPDFRAPGFFQPGSRRGFVGQALPGVALRIVDPESLSPETEKPLPPNTPGQLLVRGPNVMRGYLGRNDLTAEVVRDGWYVTGDIALINEHGFLRITDRLSRFSKIGGEMVPHGKVEDALQHAAGETQKVFAVTAIGDAKKGERLAVLHTLPKDQIPEVADKIKASGLPKIFLPRLDHYIAVEELPILGTGKLDLRQIKEVARRTLQGDPE